MSMLSMCGHRVEVKFYIFWLLCISFYVKNVKSTWCDVSEAKVK